MKSELIQEEWRPVRGYESLYDTSNFGRIRSLDHWRNTGTVGYIQKGRILKPDKTKRGYLQVQLCKDGKKKWFSVHRLVYEAFNGTIPDGMQVNHINEIKTDNSLWNLNLMTPKENTNWGIGHERSADKHSQAVLQLTYPGLELICEWSSTHEAERNGFYHSSVSACCLGKLKSHKGVTFRYKKTYSL